LAKRVGQENLAQRELRKRRACTLPQLKNLMVDLDKFRSFEKASFFHFSSKVELWLLRDCQISEGLVRGQLLDER
jgi:hypothetical protein